MPFKGENGQVILLELVALSIFLIGVLGLAIDGANLYAQMQLAQSAADAGAQAAILSIFHGTNATGANPFATAAPVSPFQCGTTDGRTPCAYARLDGFGGTDADIVTVSFPTALSGVNDLSPAPVPAVSVTVQRTVNTFLIGLLGSTASSIKVRGTAALIQSPLADCVLALDGSAPGAISVTGNANINLTTCGIADDSASGSALALTGNINIQADAIQVVGGVSEAGNISVNPTPTAGAAAVPDPLASVPDPSFNPSASCNYSGLSYTGNVTPTLSPGTYCGGLSINGNAHVTFNPGTYIFRGGLSIGGNANVTFGAGTYILQGGGFNATGNIGLTGAGVTFFNTFDATDAYAPISITGNFTANLSAPTSGPQQGMLFFQDRNAPSGRTESFTGNSNQTLTGALYFPKSTLAYTGNSSTSPENVAIVADKISLVGNASLKADPTQAAAPHQLKVALVQ